MGVGGQRQAPDAYPRERLGTHWVGLRIGRAENLAPHQDSIP
jgi:hypothetical protein